MALLNNQSNKHYSCFSLNINSFTVSEQTRRILSPYNRNNNYKLFNLNLRNFFKKIKILFNKILNDININLYTLKYLNKIKIYRKKIFKINQILIRLRNKRLIFSYKNDSKFLYLRNFIYILIKYITKIEICIYEIESIKKRFNNIINTHGFNNKNEQEFIRIQLTYVINKIRNEIQNKSFHQQADQLLITFDNLCNTRSKRDFSHLKLCEINPNIIEWCRNQDSMSANIFV